MQAAEQIINRFVTYIIDPIILLVFTAGFFLFIWGLVQFIIDLDEGANRAEGIEHMKWGIVGMVVMASVYGIISLVDNSFNLGALNGEQPDMSRFDNLTLPNNQFGGNQ